MIRYELKVDPIGYISKNLLDGTALNAMERFYVICKCPHLISHINNASRLDECLYLSRMKRSPKDIDVYALKHRANVKKALKMSPSLCANLDFEEYSKEISGSIGKIKIGDTLTFAAILDNPTIDKDTIRKVLMFRPDLVARVKDIKLFDDDSDLQIFVFKCNPMLIQSFESMSEDAVIHIINDNITNVKYLNQESLSRLDSEMLSTLLCDYVVSMVEKTYDPAIVTILINNRQEVFTALIRALVSYESFSSNVISDIIIKRLLREYNNMINDEVAEIVISGKI